MTASFDPESVDLAELARLLRSVFGPAVGGDLVGRTLLRDEIVGHLGCSQLDGENLVETMIAQGFVVRVERPDGLIEWAIPNQQGTA